MPIFATPCIMYSANGFDSPFGEGEAGTTKATVGAIKVIGHNGVVREGDTDTVTTYILVLPAGLLRSVSAVTSRLFPPSIRRMHYVLPRLRTDGEK